MAVGTFSLYSRSSNNYNTAVGYGTLTNGVGNYNTAIGNDALNQGGTSNNTAIGY